MLRCELLEHGLSFELDVLYDCCMTHHENLGRPIIKKPYHGEIFDWDKLFEIKKEHYLRQCKNTLHECQGCLYLRESDYSEYEKYISWIMFNQSKLCNSNCKYCGDNLSYNKDFSLHKDCHFLLSKPYYTEITLKPTSFEKLIEETKEIYYECIQLSSQEWNENINEYEPFVTYMLGIILDAYREFSSREKLLITEGMSKPDRVREIIKNTLGTITKKEILEKCPDISQVTVQRALAELIESEEILKIGGGRYTKYTWNNK